jgi:hypothetical protein
MWWSFYPLGPEHWERPSTEPAPVRVWTNPTVTASPIWEMRDWRAAVSEGTTSCSGLQGIGARRRIYDEALDGERSRL